MYAVQCERFAGDAGENWRHPAAENVVRVSRGTVYRYRIHSNERRDVRLN